MTWQSNPQYVWNALTHQDTETSRAAGILQYRPPYTTLLVVCFNSPHRRWLMRKERWTHVLTASKARCYESSSAWYAANPPSIGPAGHLWRLDYGPNGTAQLIFIPGSMFQRLFKHRTE
jgi:hypothetical protein